jgi:hypothetical protein
MFGAPKTAKPVQLSSDAADARPNEWPARVEALAVEAEPAALQEAPAKLAGYRADHKKDAASYKFDCRRHGDFLAVFVERGGKKEAVTVNLGRTSQFRLVKGRAPDNGRVLTYRVFAERLPGTGDSTWARVRRDDYGRVLAPESGCQYVVRPACGPIMTRHMVTVEPQTTQVGYVSHYGAPEPRVHHQTPNYPREAEDDRILFGGTDIVLHAPAGKGQSVVDRIHAEVAK